MQDNGFQPEMVLLTIIEGGRPPDKSFDQRLKLLLPSTGFFSQKTIQQTFIDLMFCPQKFGLDNF